MARFHPLDLYSVVHAIVDRAEWIREIYIFSGPVAIYQAPATVLILILSSFQIVTFQSENFGDSAEEPYIDPFLLDREIAISAANESRIPVKRDQPKDLGIDAVQIWTRQEGWKTGLDFYSPNYRL